MIKQVIIMRTDLNMRKGKMVAQGGHASMKVFFDNMIQKTFLESESYPEGVRYYDQMYQCSLTPEMIKWMNGSFAIVVGCSSEEELHELKRQADEAGIVNAIILDNGNTEFKSRHCVVCESDKLNIFYDVNREKTNFSTHRYKCRDCGTEFEIEDAITKNKPTYTCLAIGPDEAEKIDKITGNLKLL